MFLHSLLTIFLDVAPIPGVSSVKDLLILVAAVVLIAAVILIRAIRKKRAAAEEQKPAQTNTEEIRASETDGNKDNSLQSKSDPVFDERKGL